MRSSRPSKSPSSSSTASAGSSARARLRRRRSGTPTPGRRIAEDALDVTPRPLVLFLAALPELSAYQELRAGFTAAVSHELRTPLARLLVLLETATLPGADVDALVEQARQEIQQAGELIDDVLFLGELETGREVVSLGRTLALPIVQEVASALRGSRGARGDHAHGQRRRRDRAAAASAHDPRRRREPRAERDPLRRPGRDVPHPRDARGRGADARRRRRRQRACARTICRGCSSASTGPTRRARRAARASASRS